MTNTTPHYVELLSSKRLLLNNDEIVIRKRVKGLSVKPPLYMWNLTKHCYVSSLKPTKTDNIFTFDIKGKGELKLYNLILKDNGELEVELLKVS